MVRSAAPIPVGVHLNSESPHRALIDQTARFAQTFLRWLDAPGSLTYPRLRILERLHCEGPAMMSELADDAGLTRRNLTTLADALEHDGLIRRTAHPDDRRATLLELTDTGWQAAEQSLANRFAEIAALFDQLSATQRKQFGDILAKLTAAMAASPCSAHVATDDAAASSRQASSAANASR
jgi:DNA-binding MarR family transcriptional regulator